MERQNERWITRREITAVYPLALIFWNVYKDGDEYVKEVAPALVTMRDVARQRVWDESTADGGTVLRSDPWQPVDDPDEAVEFATYGSGYLEAAASTSNYLCTYADADLPDRYR